MREERGSAAIVFAITLALICGSIALAVDVGRAYVLYRQLKMTADAAALAGAQMLPQNPLQAQQTALAIAERNGASAASVSTSVSANNLDLTVNIGGSEATTFARIFGADVVNLSATSVAQMGTVQRMNGLIPLGVHPGSYAFGQQVVLKAGSGGACGGNSGNYGAIWFGDGNPGASTYQADLQSGYSGYITVGQTIETKPGDMVGPTDAGLAVRMTEAPEETFSNFSASSPRLLYLPIVSNPSDGRSSVTVEGFAAFYLESVADGQVVGEFVKTTAVGVAGTYGQNDYGLETVQLVE